MDMPGMPPFRSPLSQPTSELDNSSRYQRGAGTRVNAAEQNYNYANWILLQDIHIQNRPHGHAGLRSVHWFYLEAAVSGT